VEPVGAMSGTFSHEAAANSSHARPVRTAGRQRVTMKNRNQFIAMKLQGQQGYAMAALLVGMSVAAVLMTGLMPAWRQMSRREDEAELIFRGQQYVRAIGLFQKRSGPGVLPPNVDVLVDGRFLRKKYKDPITNQDFDLLTPATGTAPGVSQPGGAGGATVQAAQPQQQRQQPPQTQGRGFQASGSVIGAQAGAQAGGRGAGGIMGVASKSKDASIRIYNGRTRYNEWQFIYVQQTQAPGGVGAPGQRVGGPGGPPQRGNQPTQSGPGGFSTGRQGFGGRGAPPQPPPGGRGLQPAPSPFQPRR
jgi:type II secretory pathway pseudopilin PulG